MHMFIARYCDLLNVVISCDGCERMAPWHRYRCLQCMDMDLCKTCFLSELSTKPRVDGLCSIGSNVQCVFDQVAPSLRGTRTTTRW